MLNGDLQLTDIQFQKLIILKDYFRLSQSHSTILRFQIIKTNLIKLFRSILQPVMPQPMPNQKPYRSSSMQSEQSSKRSSISASNLVNAVEPINSSNNQLVVNPKKIKKQSSHSIICQQPSNFLVIKNSFDAKKHQNPQEQLLQKIKKQLIQPYRIVKKHVKQNSFSFSEIELKQVYQGMSNSLKTLEKGLNMIIQAGARNAQDQTVNMKKQLQKRLNSSSKLLKSPSNLEDPLIKQTKQHPSNSKITTSSFIPSSQHSTYIQKITSLQQQIQSLKQSHSQQLRLMIQNHEQQMMFCEQQICQKLLKVKKEYESQIQSILQAHKQREDEMRIQGQRRVSQQVHSIRRQEQLRNTQMKAQFQNKQQRYKTLAKNLICRINQAKAFIQTLTQQHSQQLAKVKSSFQRAISQFYLTSSTLCSASLLQGQQFFKVISTKVQALLEDSSGGSQPSGRLIDAEIANNLRGQSSSCCTMSIQQMFMKSQKNGNKFNTRNINGQYQQEQSQQQQEQSQQDQNQGNDLQISLQNSSFQLILQKLISLGFFSEQNEENIINLISLTKRAYTNDKDQQGDTLQPLSLVLSHTLYPLILQKIKLTLSQLWSQHQSHQNNIQLQYPQVYNKQVSEFSSHQHYNKNKNSPYPNHCVVYRNIQSIQQLQVSDSLICCGQNSYDQQDNENNKIHEQSCNYEGQNQNKQIFLQQSRRQVGNHSPIINYEGYGTQGEIQLYNDQEQQNCQDRSDGSGSFDVQMF